MSITIITVVYNAVNTLENTIKSVINQTYDQLEFIVIDGGSTDGSKEILEKYSESISFWVSEPDKGIYDAINKGLIKATGDYVLFLGADDTLNDILHIISPQFLNDNTIYYGNAYMVRSNISYAGVFNIYKIAHQNICHQAIFYPRKVFDIYEYNIENKVHADYELNLTLFADKDFKFKYIDETISNYSETGYSTISSDFFYDKDRFKILKNKFPTYIYCYARLRYVITKILKG